MIENIYKILKEDLALGIIAVLLAAILYIFRRYEKARDGEVAAYKMVFPVVAELNKIFEFFKEKVVK